MLSVDVAILGAGVLGCSVARELSRYEIDTVVLERECDLGEGSSKANSGIVHAGFHPRGGSLKGRSCVQGNQLFSELAEQLQVPLIRTGALMVAFHQEGVKALQDKAERAQLNGAGRLQVIHGDEAREKEPRLSSAIMAALVAPTTAITSPFELVVALAQNAQANKTAFQFNAEVEHVEKLTSVRNGSKNALGTTGHRYTLHLKDGTQIRARYVVNVTGDNALVLDAQIRPVEYVIRPRLGEYIVFDKQDNATALKHVLYQAEETDEGGTLLTPTVDGNLLAGPTSRNVRFFHDTATTKQGLDHVLRVALKLVPDLDVSQMIGSFAGVRANITNVEKEKKDFVVRSSAPGFISALGIKNPGMTSAPYLARTIISLLEREGLVLVARKDFNPIRKAHIPFLRRSMSEQAQALADDPTYAHMLCRCESITEGDVRAILRSPLPPSTLNGVKIRLRTGMGRCQGAYCSSRVAAIIADEQGLEVRDVLKGSRGGRVVKREVK